MRCELRDSRISRCSNLPGNGAASPDQESQYPFALASCSASAAPRPSRRRYPRRPRRFGGAAAAGWSRRPSGAVAQRRRASPAPERLAASRFWILLLHSPPLRSVWSKNPGKESLTERNKAAFKGLSVRNFLPSPSPSPGDRGSDAVMSRGSTSEFPNFSSCKTPTLPADCRQQHAAEPGSRRTCTPYVDLGSGTSTSG
jgi:hypothetical protein